MKFDWRVEIYLWLGLALMLLGVLLISGALF